MMLRTRILPTVVALLLLLSGCAPVAEPCPEPKPCPECPPVPVSGKVPNQPIPDTPNQHNMFMLGDRHLFVEHMPMFTKEDHMYQLILRVELPENVMAKYREVRREHPNRVPNLVNTEQDELILPSIISGDLTEVQVDVYADYNGETAEPSDQLFSNVPMKVLQVVHGRHFDYSFNYPGESTYILFGRDDEAHLSRYITRDPDFQNLLTLPAPPGWISQEQLRASVDVNFVDIPGSKVPCKPPLTEPSYTVRFQGWESPTQTLDLGDNASRWFSTANLLNAKDPCAR